MQGQGLKRLKRHMTIYAVLQAVLTILLLFMGWKFQETYAAKGMLNVFFNSILMTIVLQLLFFYPIYRFAGNEARNELAAQQTTKAEELQALRQKRIFGDFMKAAIFIFYGTFVVMSPAFTFVLSTVFFSFIATALTYLQSFNFTMKKIIAKA